MVSKREGFGKNPKREIFNSKKVLLFAVFEVEISLLVLLHSKRSFKSE